MMGSIFLSNSAQYCGALGLNSKHTNMLESNFISNSAVIDGPDSGPVNHYAYALTTFYS